MICFPSFTFFLLLCELFQTQTQEKTKPNQTKTETRDDLCEKKIVLFPSNLFLPLPFATLPCNSGPNLSKLIYNRHLSSSKRRIAANEERTATSPARTGLRGKRDGRKHIPNARPHPRELSLLFLIRRMMNRM